MSDRSSNPYNLKTQKEKGYLFEEKPNDYLTAEEFIFFLNKKKILIDRTDNLPRFANNNNIVMAKMKRVGQLGSTPTIYKIPSDFKIEEIIKIQKNNNNTLLGRIILEKKKKKILEIFDSAPNALDYNEEMKDSSKKEKEKLMNKKWKECESKTSIAKKVEEALGVNCNRKLVSSVLSKKRSSQLGKLLKIS